MYRLDIDFAPPYELLISIKAYVRRAERRTLDLGTGWVRRVRESLTPDLVTALSAPGVLDTVDLLDLLVRRCPGERGVTGFLGWLASLSAGDLYEILMPFVPDRGGAHVRELAARQEEAVGLLAAWDTQYFSTVDRAILDGLAASAAEHRKALAERQPEQVVEAATNGLIIPPEPDLETVLLVPQYHYRPWNVRAFYRSLRLIEYPVDALPAQDGEVPLRLLRLTRALADESRLRILRFLSEGEASFTDLVRLTGLSKSTVHHHLVALRAAGLVLVRDPGDKYTTYMLRPDAVEEMSNGLRAYLNGH
jgi:DNA-binding transcriptional ArsR family regulator